MSDTDRHDRELLRRMFDAAVAAAQPALTIPGFLSRLLPEPPKGRLIVIGAGKASAAMARAVEDHWDGTPFDRMLAGLVITRHGYAEPCRRIEIVQAAHPVPDRAGFDATARLMALAEDVTEDDVVLCLISGGGSALLVAPLEGVTLDDKRALAGDLLRSGATISEINRVRRHLSAVKGGRLAARFHPARVVSLLISDVPGDDPVDIASGPTVADPTTVDEARDILRRYDIAPPTGIARALDRETAESVKPGDPRLARAETHLIATPLASLEAAAEVARQAGLPPHILGDAIEGEAREVGRVMAGLATHVSRHGQPFAKPCVLLSGGETTVTVRGHGRGGRNVEFLLSLAIALHGMEGVTALAADTDGVDGQEDIAGAVVTPDTLARAHALGIRAVDSLTDNDGHGFFEVLGDQVITGPTRTNVNDFRAIVVR